jgi:hypothetical protein
VNIRLTSGLYLFGLLSLADLALLPLSDGKHPPLAVGIIGALLGLASLVLVVRSLQDPRRPMRLLVGLRVLSALTELPAFVVDDVSVGVRAGAAAFVALTAVGVVLIGGRSDARVIA